VIVTEFIPRGSLFDALHHAPGSPKLTPGSRLFIAFGMARGMMSLHRQQIVHRDLKSMNILLDEDLFSRIYDFGIARFLASQTDIRKGWSGGRAQTSANQCAIRRIPHAAAADDPIGQCSR
jgi:serine/threonine protein kinase